jgi:hypothetical protein
MMPATVAFFLRAGKALKADRLSWLALPRLHESQCRPFQVTMQDRRSRRRRKGDEIV